MSVEMVVLVVPLMVLMMTFLVFCGRAASVVITLDAATAAAARAASTASGPASAVTAAEDSLAANRTTGSCTPTVDTTAFRPGGQVTVRLDCTLDLTDLGPVAVPGLHLHATATEPVDTYRTVT